MEHRCCLLHANLPSLEFQRDSLTSWSYLETATSTGICQCQQKATTVKREQVSGNKRQKNSDGFKSAFLTGLPI